MAQNSKSNEIFCDTIVYADDAAIFISCKTVTKLINKIPQIVRVFTQISNHYGADLEMNKTEILVSKQLNKTFKSIKINDCTITTKTCIKWLGYHIILNSNNTFSIEIPLDKIFAIKNGVRMFKLYNNKIVDNIKFYNIYIRPIFDLWLIDPSLINLISKYESQVLKLLGDVSSSAAIIDTYNYMGIPNIKTRLYRFAKTLQTKNIIKECTVRISSTKSNKIIPVGTANTLSDKLSRFCALNTELPETPIFNIKSFCTWRKYVRKVINNKAKQNNKNRRKSL